MTFTIATANTPVTGVTLSQTEADMTVGGETLTLTATVAPDNATDKTVTWTTSNGSVATVADGVVTAVGAGAATITATATNGTADTSDDKTATCTVTVVTPPTGYDAWAEDNGITGAWNETSGGIYNVFRYVFDVPGGAFQKTPLIDIAFEDGKVVVKTPPVVNSDGMAVSVVESSDVAGKTVTATKAVDAAGSTEFTKSDESPRFYRLSVSSEDFAKYMACHEMGNAFHAPAGSFSPDYANQQYMIVNLSSGFVAYCDSSDTVTTNFFNQAAAKGQYMVFSRVPAGSYAMRIGADLTEPQSPNATGVIAKDYYIAIFECTAAQYSYIVNSSSSTTYTPKNEISWNTIRDSTAVGSAVPNSGSGVIAKLNSRVQSKMADSTIYFDLPTETMWQIAAQASGDPRYLRFYGAGTGDLSKYAVVHTGTSASALANVGSKLPNQWGLYDMYGNVAEWCLDATAFVGWNDSVQNSADDQSLSQSPQTTGASRVFRGGGTYSADDLAWSRSGSRYRNGNSSDTFWAIGFRLARIMQ